MGNGSLTSIREVAKLAGVSPATVSRVMNGTANVNEEKKKAKSGQNALGTGMEKLQNLTKKQKMIAGAAVILIVLLIFAGTS